MTFRNAYPAFQALAAALLFGASAPVSKLLLHEIEPAVLAGLLYLGSGIGLLLFKSMRRSASGSGDAEAKLTPSDIPWLVAATLAGGVAAPIILLFSLRHTPAATASLLLNFECAATTLIAAVLFKESISRRAWGAIICITFGGIILSTDFDGVWGLSFSALGVLMACLFSGIILSLVLFQEMPDGLFITALPIMIIGAIFLVTEQHNHVHRHEEIIHEHRHAHTDGHHDRHHQLPDAISIMHTHTHTHIHNADEHAHHHMPDIHHRHGHQSKREAS